MAVYLVGGVYGRRLKGEVSPDDLLVQVPRERAYRIAEHRGRIEELSRCQTSGVWSGEIVAPCA